MGPIININGQSFELSTKLRVAYKIQDQNEHKPYAAVFASIDKMPLEKQIDILYAAFEVANPEQATFVTRKKFLDYYLDTMDLSTMMEHLKQVIEGILGKPLEAEKTSEETTEEFEKN